MHRPTRFSGGVALLCVLSAALLISSGSALARGGHHHRSRFKGSGQITVTTPSPCAPPNSSDQCYSVQGDLTINGVSFTLAANGMFDPNTCRTRRTKTCCQNVLTGQFQNPDGNVNFSSAGRACGSGNTETVKGPMQLEGADGGAFQGQKGSGVLQATIDTNTEQGTAKVSGAIHK